MAGSDYTTMDSAQSTGNTVLRRRKRFNSKKGVSQVINTTQRVGTTQVELFTASSTKAKGVLAAAKNIAVNNVGAGTLGVTLKFTNWKDVDEIGTGIFSAAYPADTYMHMILPKGESINFPTARVLTSTGESDGSSGTQAHKLDGTALSNLAPASSKYKAVTADHSSGSGDQQTNGALDDATSTTTVAVDDGDYFRVGDIIQIDTEVMEVTAISGNNLTVIRASHGSTIATHTDNENINFAFFNAYSRHDKFTTPRTDDGGKYKASNFFGYGRAGDYIKTGLLPGSIAIKCYNPGYQELGLSGITPSTNSGLTAGGSYWLKIQIDGSTAESINFVVDSSNTNFGGRNGIISKIQEVLDEKYYNTAANIFEKKAVVGIVNGDIRFTSGSYLSTSSIALSAGTDGASASYNIFGHATNPTGRIPGLNNIEGAVAARLPDDTITDPLTGETVSNSSAFMYDDGNGNLIGNGRGTINYDSGAIDFTSKPNAEFVVSANYASPLTGKLNADYKNVISEIRVHSANPKLTGKVNLVVGG